MPKPEAVLAIWPALLLLHVAEWQRSREHVLDIRVDHATPLVSLLYGTVSQLHGYYAASLVALTFVGLIFVALHKIRREKRQRIDNRELKISHILLLVANNNWETNTQRNFFDDAAAPEQLELTA